ncbi:MAG: iron-sulfur cluster co-chaperone HscB C-terminal domain-containing protein [Saprospiraceae bacterium]|nr:iron-sulfur cluster co-chaperone HscB C-terminal domain-containing protein [Saprospiraceae bacterium]
MDLMSGGGGMDRIMNYFEFYDLPMTIEMDKAALKKIYFKNSRKYHPDLHSGATDSEIEEVEKLSSVNSEAYEVLGDFGSRLKHIMTILDGGEIETPQLSPDFLMEMMEINESVENMSEEEKEQLREEVHERDQKLYKELGALVSRDLSGASSDEIDKVRAYYFERKYLLRILENLDNLAAL